MTLGCTQKKTCWGNCVATWIWDPEGRAKILRDSSFAAKDVQKLQILGWGMIFASEKGGGWPYIHQCSHWRYPEDIASFFFQRYHNSQHHCKTLTLLHSGALAGVSWAIMSKRWSLRINRMSSCPGSTNDHFSQNVMSSESHTLPWAFPKPSVYWTLSGSARWAWTSSPTSIAPACWQAARGW